MIQSVSGRVLFKNDLKLFLSTENENLNFKLKSSFNVDHGDIVKVKYVQIADDLVCDDIIILNKVKINPLEVKGSLFNKLNKNDKKLLQTLKNRQMFFHIIKEFFMKEDFLEVHTPTLVESPGVETYIEPFYTKYFDIAGKESGFYLPTSPEFSLKEALTSGLEKIFEIKKVFRNYGEVSDIHSPEFFMLEWYRSFESYDKLVDDIKNLLMYIGKYLYNSKYIMFNNHKISISEVKVYTVKELFSFHNVNLDDYIDSQYKFRVDILKALGESGSDLSNEDLFFKLFMNKIEPGLGFEMPVIVKDYPLDMAALSNPCKYDPRYGERLELYIAGIELANGFGELTCPDEQVSRFEEVLQKRENKIGNDLVMPKRFISALGQGMPPATGIALGVERLFMLFEGADSLKDVALF